MSTAVIPEKQDAPVYVAAVDPQAALREYERLRDQAIAGREREERSFAAWKADLDARDDLIRATESAAAVARDLGAKLSQNEVARQLGLNSSTFRAVINKGRE